MSAALHSIHNYIVQGMDFKHVFYFHTLHITLLPEGTNPPPPSQGLYLHNRLINRLSTTLNNPTDTLSDTCFPPSPAGKRNKERTRRDSDQNTHPSLRPHLVIHHSQRYSAPPHPCRIHPYRDQLYGGPELKVPESSPGIGCLPHDHQWGAVFRFVCHRGVSG